jgi:hypothetical protein
LPAGDVARTEPVEGDTEAAPAMASVAEGGET